MPVIRIATFNVENLFERPKVFNFRYNIDGDKIMKKITQLRKLLAYKNYTDIRKAKIIELYFELIDYISIREDRGKLFKRRGWEISGVKANGSRDWDGTIEYKKAKFSQTARENTAQVMKIIDADIACIIEADNRYSLKAFDGSMLRYKYKYEMLIDGNDLRGIDVGILSKYVFGNIRTHIYDKKNNKRVFSRDCLEIEVKINASQSIYCLINHFKSKGYDSDGTSNLKRKRQATRVKEILKQYDLSKEYVVVAGDLNDYPESDPLRPLLSIDKLYDVLNLEYGDSLADKWTYHYKSFEQIDYILVSEALKNRFIGAGVERRGMYNLNKLTRESNGAVNTETQFKTVTHWTNQASDHAAVWAEFKIDLN